MPRRRRGRRSCKRYWLTGRRAVKVDAKPEIQHFQSHVVGDKISFDARSIHACSAGIRAWISKRQTAKSHAHDLTFLPIAQSFMQDYS